MKKILVVGAGGFTGGFIVEEALRRGYTVWAGVRASTSRKYLADSRTKFITLDFENPESIAGTIAREMPGDDKWDGIIYNLGATKCLRFLDFSRINCDFLRNFTDALEKTSKIPQKLIYMSSLSALGPGDEAGSAPFTEETIPQPNTRYGASKLKAEMHLAMSAIPHVILRPTGIYGPRDKDYFLMFDAIRKGFDFSVGYRRQLLSFIYVTDLANAVFDALETAPCGETYNIAEPRTYTQKDFRSIVARTLGKKFVLPVKVPLWAVKAVSAVAEKIGAARGKPSTLNSDKYNIIKQRNWSVDISKAQRDFGFMPQVNLKEGVRKSIDWYEKEGWL